MTKPDAEQGGWPQPAFQNSTGTRDRNSRERAQTERVSDKITHLNACDGETPERGNEVPKKAQKNQDMYKGKTIRMSLNFSHQH